MLIEYPATKDQLVEACRKMGDVPERDKRWFVKNLPDGIYGSVEDVIEALER